MRTHTADGKTTEHVIRRARIADGETTEPIVEPAVEPVVDGETIERAVERAVERARVGVGEDVLSLLRELLRENGRTRRESLVELREIARAHRENLLETRRLRADLAGRARGALGLGDRAKLERLLPAIHALIGDAVFTVASLAEHTAYEEGAALRGPLAACGTRKALGRLLARATAHDVDGLVVRRLASDGSAIVWKVTKGGESGESWTRA